MRWYRMRDNQTTERLKRKNQWTANVFMTALAGGIDWFIPAHIRGGDSNMLRRAQLLVAFAWTLIALAIIYIACFILMGSPMNAIALGIAIGMALTSIYIMRWTGSSFVAGNLLAAAFFGVLTALSCRLGARVSYAPVVCGRARRSPEYRGPALCRLLDRRHSVVPGRVLCARFQRLLLAERSGSPPL